MDKRYGLGVMVIIAGLCFWLNIVPKASLYPRYCRAYAETYAQRREVLETIPDDVSVAATTFYTAPLWDRETLYDVKYAALPHVLECEYVVLNPSETTSYKKYGDAEAFINLLEENGYTLLAELEGQVEIYHSQK